MDHVRVYDLTQRLWYAATPTALGDAPRFPSVDQSNPISWREAHLRAALDNLKHVANLIEKELQGVVQPG